MQAYLMQNRCCVDGCFLNNTSNAHAHKLLTIKILRNFILLRAFTVFGHLQLRLPHANVFFTPLLRTIKNSRGAGSGREDRL